MMMAATRGLLLLALGAGAQEVLLSSSDLESLLTPASDVISPQGLLIVRRSTITQSDGLLVDMEENLSVFDEEEASFGLSQLLGSAFSMLSSMLSSPDRLVATRYDDDASSSHEDSAARDFECPCGRDVATLCEPSERSADDYSEFATVYDKRLCLARRRDQTSEACAQHLAEAPTVVEYCYEDIERFCADVSPGDNRVHACLAAANDLDPLCADYLATVNPKEDDDWGSIIDASFDLVRTLFEDDQPVMLQVAQATPVVDAADSASEEEEEEEEQDVQRPRRHHKVTVKCLRILVLSLASLATLVLVASLVSHIARKRKELREKQAFKQKFAPLLLEA